MITVRLDQADIEHAYSIALSRQQGKEGYASCRNYQAAKHPTTVETNFLGAKGELAVAHAMGWQIDTRQRICGDGGCDFLIGSVRIDVQTTIYSPAHLKYDSGHPFRADAAILVHAETDSLMHLVGWCGKRDFPRRCEERDYGYGLRQIVRACSLRNIETLTPCLDRKCLLR